MSISIKNISLSINESVSNQFNIELDGTKYSIDEFKMSQRLLEPCRLEFKLFKSPEESIAEVQFTTCGSIIGKDVKLSLQTDSMEQEISGFAAGTQNADIEFEGFVTSAKATRSESQYVIEVVAQTKDVILKDTPDIMYYNEETLDDIIKSLLRRTDFETEIQPQKKDKIFFTFQYNETTYRFIQRLAKRYGEWMYNNGKKLHFGKISDQESIILNYPSKDLTEYSARLKTFHMGHYFFNTAYNEMLCYNDKKNTEAKKIGNNLNDLACQASFDRFVTFTHEETIAQSIERDDTDLENKKQLFDLGNDFFQEPFTAYTNGRRANMLVYEGQSYCSKMKIGAKLTIKDNYISGESGEGKSEVQQDEILITEVTHQFNVAQKYSNTFKGITAAINYPPYFNPTIYPVCDHPIKAMVKDTEDPKHWGRVRVRFMIPSTKVANYKNLQATTDSACWTPWIHVAQPYSGAKGSGKEKYGTHLIPEINSYVYVDFEGGNMERPFVSGAVCAPSMAPVDEKWYVGNNNVKAIRTASGHTIEIHDVQTPDDFGKGGYIKIYDNHTHDYEILLSSDSDLIKLKSVGNIELSAGKDIIMTAGNDIKMTADNDINVTAKHDKNVTVKNNMKVDVTHQKTETSENYKQTVQDTAEVKAKSIKDSASDITSEAAKSLKMTTPDASLTAGMKLSIKSGGTASITSGGTMIIEGALISMN
jgi:uncharacterized protein involved in type VI secretion and phage assembly